MPLRGEGSCGGGGAPRDSAGSGATEEGKHASFHFMAAVTICIDFGAPQIKSDTVSTVSPSISHEVPPRHAHGDLTSLAPHERLPEILVVPRPGSQSLSRGEAKDSALLSSCGGILELRRGSQPSPWVGPGKPNLPLGLRGKAGHPPRSRLNP